MQILKRIHRLYKSFKRCHNCPMYEFFSLPIPLINIPTVLYINWLENEKELANEFLTLQSAPSYAGELDEFGEDKLIK